MVVQGIIDSISSRDENLSFLNKMLSNGINHPDVRSGIRKLELAKTTSSGRLAGAPIGNYISQWFGNLYMSVFDHFVKDELRCEGYVRYCDDFVLFSNEKEELHNWRLQINDFLWNKLRLFLSKQSVFPTSRGVDFLGYRHFPEGYVLLRKTTAKRIKNRMKNLSNQIAEEKISPERALGQVASAKGWLKFAKTYNFQRSINFEGIEVEVRKYCGKI